MAAQPEKQTVPQLSEQTATQSNEQTVSIENKEAKESTTDKFKKEAKEKFSIAKNAAKKFGKEMQEKSVDRLSMEGILKQAQLSLEQFLDPELKIEQQIPTQLLAGARGIVFLSSIKAAFGFGGNAGTGVIITRLEYGEGWSAPCSIGAGGLSGGFTIGVQKTDFVMVLRDSDAVKTFTGKGQIQLGIGASVAAGPIGRDAGVSIAKNEKGYAAILTYSRAKGLYAGLSLEGQVITVRDDCNAKYYGKTAEAKDILTGNIENIENANYDEIIALLNKHTNDKALTKEELQKMDQDESKQPI